MVGIEKLKTMLGRLFSGRSPNSGPASGERTVAVQGDAKSNQIFTGDVHISVEKDTPTTNARSPLHQLPADVADFAGRGTQMEKLLGLLSAPGGRAAISAIDGMGGLGKTTLAVHVAHRLRHYPDGQIVVDMA